LGLVPRPTTTGLVDAQLRFNLPPWSSGTSETLKYEGSERGVVDHVVLSLLALASPYLSLIR